MPGGSFVPTEAEEMGRGRSPNGKSYFRQCIVLHWVFVRDPCW